MTEKPIRALVIDDSAYNRKALSDMLASAPDIEVVGRARDGEDGLAKVRELAPDVITLDIEMPRMDGFTFLRILMSRWSTPVIVVSSRDEDANVFRALELGAVDFIAKPSAKISGDIEILADELVRKVRLCRMLKMDNLRNRTLQFQTTPRPETRTHRKEAPPAARPILSPKARRTQFECVAIGASTGGPSAIQYILTRLPSGFHVPIMISQHMPEGFTKPFAERLNENAALEVREAQQGETVQDGVILIAPGGRNMRFERKGAGVGVRLLKRSPEERFVPSVNAMFESLAKIYRSKLLAVVLTGMGNDGKAGALTVKAHGGEVLVESEESAVIFGMPQEVMEAGAADSVLSLEEMPEAIAARVRGAATTARK